MTTIVVTPPARPNINVAVPAVVNIEVDPHDQGPPGIPGPPGPPGPAAPGAFYVHTQGVAATVWTIDHNLGYQPAITLFDNSGEEFEGDITNPTVNQSVVTLAYAISGTATAS